MHDPQLLISTPSPPLEPPAVLLLSYGLFVCPTTLFLVSIHLFNSGILLVAIIIAPASFINRTHSASSVDLALERATSPMVCNLPFTAVLSLVVKGTPRKGFRLNSSSVINPFSIRSSMFRASSVASSVNGPSTMPFKRGLTYRKEI